MIITEISNNVSAILLLLKNKLTYFASASEIDALHISESVFRLPVRKSVK